MDIPNIKNYTHEELVRLGLTQTEVNIRNKAIYKLYEMEYHLLKETKKEENREIKRKLKNMSNKLVDTCSCGMLITRGAMSNHRRNSNYHKKYVAREINITNS